MPAPVIGALAHQRIIQGTDYRQTVFVSNSPTRVTVDGMQDRFGYSFSRARGILTLYGNPERLVVDEEWIIYAENSDGTDEVIATYDVVEAPPLFGTIPRAKIGRGIENNIGFPFMNNASEQSVRGLLIGLEHRVRSNALGLEGNVPDVDYSVTSGTMRARIANSGGIDTVEVPFDIVLPPSAVRNLRGSSTRSGVVTLSWLSPLTWGDVLSGSYQVREGDDDPVTVVSTSYRLLNTYDAGTYSFSVRPVNTDGVGGPWESVSVTVVRATVPGIPSVIVSVSGTTVTVRWTAPDDGGSTILGYEVEVGGSTRTVSASSRSASFTGVSVGTGTAYVRARNLEGYGSRGSASYTVAETSPGAVSFFNVRVENITATTLRITLSWGPPSFIGSGASSYFYQLEINGLTVVIPASTTTRTFDAPAGTYIVRIRIQNNLGRRGPWTTRSFS